MSAKSSAAPAAVPLDLDAAFAHIASGALRETARPALVGLELEFHLVDLADAGERPGWDRIQELLRGLPALPSASSVTLEPGGQVELSTPPAADVAASITALQADRAALGAALAAAGFGVASLGTDPARPARRVNPSARYVAMEAHFAARGCAEAGAAMMTSTAALQVNLDAGPAAGWNARVGLLHDLGPVLMAVSACSPLLAGRESGWHSARQQIWQNLDQARCAEVRGGQPGAGDPGEAWARFALEAPVMLVPGDTAHPEVAAVTDHVRLADWVEGRHPFHRPPTTADLDYHLTTLFPPVRPRGYLELRYLDAQPDRWWPALAALTVALADTAPDEAAGLAAPARGRWVEAARDGLADPVLRRAAAECLELAVRTCAPEVKADVEAYAELVASGRTPGDELRERAAATSPLTVLEEEARRA